MDDSSQPFLLEDTNKCLPIWLLKGNAASSHVLYLQPVYPVLPGVILNTSASADIAHYSQCVV